MQVRRIPRAEVCFADTSFITGTAAEVRLCCVGAGRFIGEGKRGRLTEKLQGLYFDAVKGKLPQHKEWLTLVKG